VLNVDVLTQKEMEAIDKRQVQQQSEWKRIPREGQFVSFLGTELLVLPGVFPPKEDTVLLAKHLPTMGAVSVLDVGTGTGSIGNMGGAARRYLCDRGGYCRGGGEKR
jgi:methylase of polypeptide subunit release factors